MAGMPLVGPVFVGGTGSSGTTVTARLIGHHQRYAFVPVELKFHADPAGLPGVLCGKVSLDDFLQHMRRQYRRTHHTGGLRGLYRLIDEDRYNALLADFKRRFQADRVGASRSLVEGIVAPVLAESGKPSWVEMTPGVISSAPTLFEIFPASRFVHSVADGRTVVFEKMRRSSLKDFDEALAWWTKKIRRAERALERVPDDRVLTLRIEDLIRGDRQRAFRRLCAFLELDDDEGVREYFEVAMPPARATFDRWRVAVPEHERSDWTESYSSAVAGLGSRTAQVLEPLEPASASSEIGDVVWVNPAKINLVSVQASAAPVSVHGRVDHSAWSETLERPFDELEFTRAFRDHLTREVPWEETELFRSADGEQALLRRYAERAETVYRDILEAGYRTQRALGTGDASEEIQVGIRADGRFILLDGQRRLATARLLKIPTVPVFVVERHPEWVAFTRSIRNLAEKRGGRIYQVIDHPDLVDLPAYHGWQRFEMMSEALNGYDCHRRRLLDIGCHWGYMSQQMEKLGFECTGVEINDREARIAQVLRDATESRFRIWKGSIFDFPEPASQDVVLALNVFNHLIKTEELHTRLTDFLGRLNAELIFFEPHVASQPGKMPPNAYRNYAPLEFAEFVAGHSGMTSIECLGLETEHHSPYKRSLYLLSR